MALRDQARNRADSTRWVPLCVEAALDDPHPFVRSEAAAALKTEPDENVVPLLAAALSTPDPGRRFRAERLLVRRPTSSATDALEAELRSNDRKRRLRAASALGRVGDHGLEALTRLAGDDDSGIRSRAAKALAVVGRGESVGTLVRLLEDTEAHVRLAAASGLARIADRPGLSEAARTSGAALLRLIDSDPEPDVRRAALLAAAAMEHEGGHKKTGLTIDPRSEPDPATDWAAVELLARCGDHDQLAGGVAHGTRWWKTACSFALALHNPDERALLDLLAHDQEPSVRFAAIRGLAASTPSEGATEALTAACRDDDDAVAWLARRACAGTLDARHGPRQASRGHARGPSASWPFGLPPPDPKQPRKPRLPLALAALNLSYNLNLGVLIRSAEAAGAEAVLIVGRDFFHRTAAMGADRWIDVRVFPNHGAMIAFAREQQYQLVAVQQTDGAERFDMASYPPRPCLLLGSEGHGLPPYVCAAADLVVQIPQPGEIDSLNVTCAATLVLWACLANRGWI